MYGSGGRKYVQSTREVKAYYTIYTLLLILSRVISGASMKIPKHLLQDARNNEAHLRKYFGDMWQEEINKHPIETLRDVYDNIDNKKRKLNDADEIEYMSQSHTHTLSSQTFLETEPNSFSRSNVDLRTKHKSLLS
jgi:hypothetical protein